MIAGRCRLYRSRHRRLPLVCERSTASSWPTCCQTTTHSYSTPSHPVFNSSRYTHMYIHVPRNIIFLFIHAVRAQRPVCNLSTRTRSPSPPSIDTRLNICTLSRRACAAPLAVVRRTFLS